MNKAQKRGGEKRKKRLNVASECTNNIIIISYTQKLKSHRISFMAF